MVPDSRELSTIQYGKKPPICDVDKRIIRNWIDQGHHQNIKNIINKERL